MIGRLHFLIAGDEPDVGVEMLMRRVGLQFQLAHPNHGGAGTQFVKKINKLLVGRDDVDILHQFDKEFVRARRLPRGADDADAALGGLRLNRAQKIDGLVFRRDDGQGLPVEFLWPPIF